MLGTKVLKEVISPINGKIRVVKTLGLGTYIQVENLTQSGGLVYEVWEETLRKLRKEKKNIRNCLILGLGGGSAAFLVKKFWPGVKVVGVDIDPVMVTLGKKYLGLKADKIVISDAWEFLEVNKEKYDLILIDTYVGYTFPEKFEDKKFLSTAKSTLTKGGIAVFNRLYFAEKRPQAVRFGEKLEKVFTTVAPVYPEANIMFICYN